MRSRTQRLLKPSSSARLATITNASGPASEPICGSANPKRIVTSEIIIAVEYGVSKYYRRYRRRLFDHRFDDAVSAPSLRLWPTALSCRAFDQSPQYGLQCDVAFHRTGLSALKLDPTFVKTGEHLNAGCRVLHSLRLKEVIP